MKKNILKNLKFSIVSRFKKLKGCRRFFENPIDDSFFEFLKREHGLKTNKYTDCSRVLKFLQVPSKISDEHSIEIKQFQMKLCKAKSVRGFQSLPCVRVRFYMTDV